MKRILLSAALLSITSLSFAMQMQLHEPSERTRKYVEQALKAFEIPLASVTVYGFTPPGSETLLGIASSEEGYIALNENTKSELGVQYVSFHETAHIKDEIHKKIDSHAKYLTATSVLGYFALSVKAFGNLQKTIQPRFLKPLSYVANGIFGFYCLGNWIHSNISVPWAHEQAEYRADKMAIEKLLSINEISPILMQLYSKKEAKKRLGNQRVYGHPPADLEYKAMKKTIQNHGYEVKKYRPTDAPNDLKIKISKNGKHASLKASNFYLKV